MLNSNPVPCDCLVYATSHTRDRLRQWVVSSLILPGKGKSIPSDCGEEGWSWCVLRWSHID